MIRIRAVTPARSFSLWLPVFLIWPLVGLVALFLAPFVLTTALILWPAGRGRRRGLGQAIQSDAIGFEEPEPQGGLEKRCRVDLVADSFDVKPRARAIADAEAAGRSREGELAAQAADSDLDLARR